jgi:glycosyltransferase involved in cell wall biosynthesis
MAGGAKLSGELRVLHVVEATTAGVGRHVIDLSTHMRRAGLDVVVACPRVRENAQADTRFVDNLAAEGVPVSIVPMRRGVHPMADMRAYVHLSRLIRHRAYDVVHAHSSKAGVLGRLAAWRGHVSAVVYTPNAFAFLGARDGWACWLYRTVERWLGWRLTDALICVSRSEMALAEQCTIAPSNRLVLIENAIDPSRFDPTLAPAAAKSALGLDPSRPVVGYIGRLARQKGLDCLVRAAQQLVAAGQQAQFLLVGEGECEGALRRLVAAYDLQHHVVLTGYRIDVLHVLAALDIVVLPSLYEGLPYTLLEAMAAGRAIVATDVAGNRDLIQQGKTGVLVPGGDAWALANALMGLLAVPEQRRRLGRAAWMSARSRPTVEQMAHQTVETYLRVLKGQE